MIADFLHRQAMMLPEAGRYDFIMKGRQPGRALIVAMVFEYSLRKGEGSGVRGTLRLLRVRAVEPENTGNIFLFGAEVTERT